MPASVRWHTEEQTKEDGRVRRVQAAWLVADVADEGETRTRYLAYLGNRPHVTQQLRDEWQILYPDIEIDWADVISALENPPPMEAISLEDLAQHWGDIVAAQGLNPIEIEMRLGRGRHRPLSDLARLLADPGVVGRVERTSGSIMAYMLEFHPDYAYAVAKLALLLGGHEKELERLEEEEPSSRRKIARPNRVKFWRDSCKRVQLILNS